MSRQDVERYLDAKYSRWISTDPALGEYIPKAGKGTADEASKLAGQGGIFNSVNGNLYHYAGNNPVKYVDPDGRDIIVFNRSYGAGGYGHNAVMVGNDKDGWIFYSKDDTDVNTRIEYKTLDDFLTVNHNATEEDRYDHGVRATTTPVQDKKMQEYGDENYTRGYSLAEKTDEDGNVTQNCADLVADIVSNAEGINIGKPKIQKGSQTRLGPYQWKGITFRNGGITSPVNTNITWPNQQLEDFRENNTTTEVEIR